MKSRCLALTCCLLLAWGCSRSTPSTQPTSGTSAPAFEVAPAPSAAPAAPGRDASAGQGTPLSTLPPRLEALGGTCQATDGGRDWSTLMCNEGAVAGVWVPVDTVQNVPPRTATVIRDEPRRDLAPGRSLVVALEGDRLWIRQVTCGACRRVMGRSFVGLLPKLTDEQLGVIQGNLGLPQAPALRTPEDWRKIYAGRPLPTLPDGSVPMNSPR